MMNIIRLYIYPLFLGFVIVPLLVWPMVVALAACIITLSFLGEMLFSIPLMIRRISLLQLQLWLSAEYALFFCVMCCVGWQFTRRTQSELKSRLHCWLVFAPVYLWLILWNIIFYIAPAKIALLESIRNFFLLVVWLTKSCKFNILYKQRRPDKRSASGSFLVCHQSQVRLKSDLATLH